MNGENKSGADTKWRAWETLALAFTFFLLCSSSKEMFGRMRAVQLHAAAVQNHREAALLKTQIHFNQIIKYFFIRMNKHLDDTCDTGYGCRGLSRGWGEGGGIGVVLRGSSGRRCRYDNTFASWFIEPLRLRIES